MLSTSNKKPAVALVNEGAARRNIVQKLRAFEVLLKGEGPPRPEWLPRSLRQFNKWSSDTLPEAKRNWKFQANAPETLRRDAATTSAVLQLLDAARMAEPKPASPKSETVARLKAQKLLYKTLRDIAEKEVVVARREAVRLRTKVLQLEAQLESLGSAATNRIAELEKRLEAIELRNAQLVIAVRETTKLGRPR